MTMNEPYSNCFQTYTPPGKLGSDACAADSCCVWDYISNELVELFTNKDGTCNDLARASVRLGFHDAGAWSKTSGFGGADGSLILNEEEIARPENAGLAGAAAAGQALLKKYPVGAADLVQFMHNVAVVTCPLGPRGLTYIGRKDSSKSPTGLLPDTTSSVDILLELFANKTIGTIDLISLIGAHTTASQRFFNPAKAGPLDTTNGVWDVAFYSESLGGAAPQPGTFRLPSDHEFSLDNRTARGFTVFSDPATGQATWNAFYAKAYTRLSLLGVNNINDLTDCTKVLPPSKPVFPIPASNSSSSSSVSRASTSSVSSSATVHASATVTSSSSHKVYTSASHYYPNGTYSHSYSYSKTSSGSVVVKPTFSKKSSVSAKPTVTSKPVYTTSTVYSTTTYTVTKCPPTVTKCPLNYSSVVTSVIAVSTTVCPYEEAKPTSSTSTKGSSVPVKPVKHVSYGSSASTPAAPVVTGKPSSKAPACHTVFTTTTVYV
jgi:hypothetical protein